METSAFISKFHKLPEEFRQQVLELMDTLLAQIKHGDTTPFNLPNPEFPNGKKKPIALLSHKGMMLPITPATETPNLKSLSGIWKNKEITIETLREKAWGGRQ